MNKFVFAVKSLTDGIVLFFISTFIAHCLMSSMSGDYVDQLMGKTKYSEQAVIKLKEELGLSDSGFMGLLNSYRFSLATVTEDFIPQKTNRFPYITWQKTGLPSDISILNYVKPTLVIVLFSVVMYLIFTVGFAIFFNSGGSFQLIRSVVFSILILLSLFPVFASSRFMFHLYESQISGALTWEVLLGSPAMFMVIVFFFWALIQGLCDGSFIDGVRGVREEYIKIKSQPYILYQRINGGPVFRHLTKGILPYILSISYYRFLQLLGGTIVLEFIFNIKGLGWITWLAVDTRDQPKLFAITAFTMFCVSLVSIIHSLIQKWIDPRYGAA